jgi:hypothetical protein
VCGSVIRLDEIQVRDLGRVGGNRLVCAPHADKGCAERRKRGGHAPTTPEWQAAIEDAAKGETA